VIVLETVEFQTHQENEAVPDPAPVPAVAA